MGKDSFSWKSLFINDNNNNEVQENTPQQNNAVVEKPVGNQFPTAPMPTSPNLSSVSMTSSSSNPFLAEVLEVYEKGFDGLNSEGFDFFELYKSVIAVGATNPQSYQMAFAMGKSLKPDISKQFLLDKSQYYVTEIEKVFKNYDVVGNSKQKELNQSIIKKKEDLTKDITDISAQIAKLQADLQAKSNELQQIDIDNKDQFLEIQQKIEANTIAKQKILESINTVISGINQYL